MIRLLDANELYDRVQHFGGRGKNKMLEMIASQPTVDSYEGYIRREDIESALNKSMRSLIIIGEILVDESKLHMSSSEAIEAIRKEMGNVVCSRVQLQKLLDRLESK